MSQSKPSVETDVGLKGALLKRKDFLGVDEKAHSHPNRTYYFRKNQDLDDIIDTCTKKLRSDPNNGQALFLRGSSYFKKQYFPESVRDFDILLRNYPNHVDGLFNRVSLSRTAKALTKIGKSERAIEDLSRVLAINPEHVTAAFARATCYNEIGQLDRAIEDYNLALMGQPMPGDIHSDAGSPVPSDDYGTNDGDMSRLTYQNDGEGSPAVVLRGGAGRGGSAGNNEQGDRDSGSNSPMSVRSSGRFSNYHQFSPAATPTASGSGAAQSGFSNYPSSDNYGNMSQSGGGLTRSRVNSASGNSLETLNIGAPSRPVGLGPRGMSGSNSVNGNHYNNTSSSNLMAALAQSQGGPQGAQGLNPIAEEHHARGYHFRKQNKFQEAIQEYSKAIAAEPRHFKALFNRGFAHDKIGLFDLAIADYTRAIEIDNANSFCYYNRGISNDRKGTLDAAMADFTTAITLQPNNAEFYHNRAFCLRKLGKLTAAMEDYTVSLKLLPNNFKALYNRACCHEKLDQLDEAMIDCNAALAVQPMHGGCLLTKALLLDRTNQLPDALAAYTAALQNNAEPFQALSSRAKVHGRMGNYHDSVADLSSALEIQKDLGLLFSRAMCYKSLEQYDSAIRDFSEVVSIDPKNVAAFNHRGYCHRKLEKYDLAIADYSACIQLAPANVRAYNNRAYILAKLTRYSEAVEDYSIVIKHDPRSVHAYHNRGISYDKLGLIDLAIADFTKVLDLEPQSYGENGMETGGSRQAATEAVHNLLQQKQEQQHQNGLLVAQAAFAGGGAPPPPPQNNNSTQPHPNRLPSALKASNPAPAGGQQQIQNGNFYVPRGAVSAENKPVPKYIERQQARRPSVGSTTSARAVEEETESIHTEEDESSEPQIDEAALAQHNELGNRLSQMSNLLKGFGAPVQPLGSAASGRVDVPSSSSRPTSVYRAPVPLVSQQDQRGGETESSPAAQANTAAPPRLPSAVVPSKWASRVNNNNNNNPAESRGWLSIDTAPVVTFAGTRVSPLAASTPSPVPNGANINPNSAASTPSSVRSGPVSAAVFLNSLKKPSAPVPNNAQNMVGSAGPVHRFSSQGGFSPRPTESNNY